jgi:hypothetical protein
LADQTIPLKTWKIYRVTNLTNGKRYVGQTVRAIPQRWAAHVSAANTNSPQWLAQAIKKYGADNFIIEVIDTVFSHTEALAAEAKWIAFYDATGADGYNMTGGGPGIVGYRHTDEAKAKMSKARKGKPRPPGFGPKISAALKGRHHSPETRAKIGDVHRGLKHTPEARAKMSAALRGRIITSEARTKIAARLRGRKHSEERRRNESLEQLGKKLSPETRAKIGLASASRRHTPEARAKMSRAQKGRIVSLETRAKMGASLRGKPHAPEHREANRQAQLKRWARHRAEQQKKQYELDL